MSDSKAESKGPQDGTDEADRTAEPAAGGWRIMPVSSAGPQPMSRPYPGLNRVLIGFLGAACVALAAFWLYPGRTAAKEPVVDLFTATLDDVAAGLEARRFTSVQLSQAYLGRIAQVNSIVRAVIEVNPHALHDAAIADEMRASNSAALGNLHGIPILLKDNIATARPNQTFMNTTAGSYALLGSIPAGDATVTKNLLKAGAILLGKTSMSEWANWRSSNDTKRANGWCARSGQGLGVYYANQDPSGSSSGSGVAAALGLAVATIGSETDGSIISPGQFSALCAIKPTVGLVSRHGAIPISNTQDTIGPMARDCKTAAALLSVMAGKDQNDKLTSAIPFDTVPNYAQACQTSGLKNARIGIPSSFIAFQQPDADIWTAFNASWSIMESAGTSVLQEANFPCGEQAINATLETESLVMAVEFRDGIAGYFKTLRYNPSQIIDIHGLIDFTKKTVEEEYEDRDIGRFTHLLDLNLTLHSAQYLDAVGFDRKIGQQAIDGVLDRYGLDAIILPTSIASGIAAIAGHPVVTVPLGFFPTDTVVRYNVKGNLVQAGPHIPFGISFIGKHFSEEKLIAYACAWEAATLVRQKGPQPYIIPNVNLRDFVDI